MKKTKKILLGLVVVVALAVGVIVPMGSGNTIDPPGTGTITILSSK
jgi:hypothetical protein